MSYLTKLSIAAALLTIGVADAHAAEALDPQDHGRPVAAVARELGVTPEAFRAAFRLVTPAAPGALPTDAQREHNRKVLAEALGVSPELLDTVMDKYRPGGATGQR